MSRLQEIERQIHGTQAMVQMTSVFEGIASMKIARIKNQVQQATIFFDDLWNIYTQIRVDSLFRFGRSTSKGKVNHKELFIIITAEGGFSGDIDQKLVRYMLEDYDPETKEIIVIGHHGAVQLAQKGIQFKKYYKLPSKDQNINVSPIIRHVQEYENTTVYYQQYVSLMVQDVHKITLTSAVDNIAKDVEKGDEVISEVTYIFEPSTYVLVDHLERSMMQIALEQLILDSKLAQYASRFKAMSASHQAADEQLDTVTLRYNRARRGLKDERLKEIINGIKKAGQTT
jgi:F-type H+-transporting ATPase subunit gamma